MSREATQWEQAVEFHGHECPGLALGFRAALIGLRELRGARAGDEELVAVVETDSCGVDAVQFITGCTMGKGNLILRDLGKQVYTFLQRRDSLGIRVARRHGTPNRNPEDQRLSEKVWAGTATPEEHERLRALRQEDLKRVLEAPEEELFSVRPVHQELPPRARIFASVQCQVCGEGVMEARVHLIDGKAVCGDCYQPYPARWKHTGGSTE